MIFSFYQYKVKWQKSLISVSIILAVCFFSFEFFIPICRAEEGDKQKSIDFTSFSLEELKQVTIISVLKKPQKLSEATSAITVITHEDIRRSGATSIPELLRSVPGFQVAQIDSSTWAVSARGFNHNYANKLLVLMDGRSLYTPFFSGVYWHTQDTLFEDIDRIEVIRGPGATLWGANAVNGVINIITKKAKDTQGWLVTSGLGNEEKRFGAIRYGNKLGENAYGRIYLKYFEKDDFLISSEFKENGPWRPPPNTEGHGHKCTPCLQNNEGWNSLRGGGRIDWSFSHNDSLTLQGDIYAGKDRIKKLQFDTNTPIINIFDNDDNFSGGNVIFRWMHTFSESSNTVLQLYYDKTKQERESREAHKYTYKVKDNERFDTFDFDFQHNLRLGKRQEFIWGLGYRFIKERFEESIIDPNRPDYLFDPSNEMHLFSAFLQDEISVIKNRLQFTIGSKFEHNDYTGFEIQPNVRLLWKPTDLQNVWVSASRAVRTPSRFEYENPPNWYLQKGEQAEDLIAYELGYRIQLTKSFCFDLASYFNEYDDLFIPFRISSEAETFGLEFAANWDVLEWWGFRASYSYLHMHINKGIVPPFDPNHLGPPPDPNKPLHDPFDPNDLSDFDKALDISSPEHQFVIHSSMDLSWDLELDIDLRYVDNLNIFIGSYTEMDVRLGWKPRKNLELSIVGRNLLHKHHPEFLSKGNEPYLALEIIEIERSVYGKIICLF